MWILSQKYAYQRNNFNALAALHNNKCNFEAESMDPNSSTGPMYRLEKQTEPNVAVDLDLTLESQSTLEFCLVRENSTYYSVEEQQRDVQKFTVPQTEGPL